MTIALSVKDKLGLINESIETPDGTDLNLLIVNSSILNSVSKEISTSIIYSELAVEIRLDLQDIFQ